MNFEKLGTVAVTHAPRKLLTADGKPTRRNAQKRLRWWADNCIALAKLLVEVPPNRHDQSDWAEEDKPPCETSACAMGWAALRHVTPGLQYAVTKESDEFGPSYGYQPLVNGAPSNFWEAGRLFFGPEVVERVFNNTMIDKLGVIDKLVDHAWDYRERAKRTSDAKTIRTTSA